MLNNLKTILKQYWGYEGFRPFQEQAMLAVAHRGDSLVVLPTGGGKSLCFQAPALALEGLAVVVSPLISLMKDQVDTLIECGVAAARIDSSQSSEENKDTIRRVSRGEVKILYLSPERLVSDWFIEFLGGAKLSMIAIDEAHCISMWGHDFRPEYRQLDRLKTAFRNVAIHAFTATATQQVRDDIIERLKLDNPTQLVGSFDRPNLFYKTLERRDIHKQVEEVISRHRGESGIVYCIRRRDVDEMCAVLQGRGYKAIPYHAGMEDIQRRQNQDAFINDQAEIIVATVAFGMGIDKPDVRYVIHAGMPKSIENYQQESGRAGRDGLQAECLLFYSGADFAIWKYLNQDLEPEPARVARQKLQDIYQYCVGFSCRHRVLLDYFGQPYDPPQCGACDICVEDFTPMPDSLVTAQKIVSCVYRLDQRFGGDYTAAVLTGSADQRILAARHDELTTYGLLRHLPKHIVRTWIEQLVGQGCLKKSGEYNVLTITETGNKVLKGDHTPKLLAPIQRQAAVKKTIHAPDSWQGVDQRLFEELRLLRQAISLARHLPPYMVFGDATLRDMARCRPSTLDSFLQINGVGQKKLDQYGRAFVDKIIDYCRQHKIKLDVDIAAASPPPANPAPPRRRRRS